MTFELHTFEGVSISANSTGLWVRPQLEEVDCGKRETWARDALDAPGGWKTAVEVEQLLELGLAEPHDRSIVVPFGNFEEIDQIPFGITKAWTKSNPFILKIDRYGDLGTRDFKYKYEFLSTRSAIYVDRVGYYIQRPGDGDVFRLDSQTFALVEAMDRFNALLPEEKGQQESWLTFAKVKGCAREVGAALDMTLQANDVIVPSSISLDIYEDQTGAMTFLPKCAGFDSAEFRQVFERNSAAQGLYSVDRPGLGRVRVVLTDNQREVLKRMKRVRGLTGPTRDSVKENPAQVFDGVLDSVELPYGDRVVGIGEFVYAPTPHLSTGDGGMAKLWESQGGTAFSGGISLSGAEDEAGGAGTDSVHPQDLIEPLHNDSVGSTEHQQPVTDQQNTAELGGAAGVTKVGQRVLLIDTDDEYVRSTAVDAAQLARGEEAAVAAYQRPEALQQSTALQEHQEAGIHWLQTCCRIKERSGVLLADDMGLGKTLQVLAFLAWGIESGQFPDLANAQPPYRPVLIIVPLILLENRTWECEMERFFENRGSIFWPVLALHGDKLKALRALDAEGRETQIGRPVLDLDRLQKHRVIITTYETITNYQHSFAYFRNGKSLWSAIVTDEAQGYKTPNTRISHAIKALKPDFHIASTGTPVENRLLDLWNLFDTIQQGLLLSAKEFRDTYELPIAADGSADHLESLKKKLLFQRPHAFLLRRNKSDIATLPPKRIQRISCSMSEAEVKLHRELIRGLHEGQGNSHHLTVLQKLAALYQHPALLGAEAEGLGADVLLCGCSKLGSIVDLLHQIRGMREKVLIFARHREMQSILAKVIEAEFGLPVRIINGLTKRAVPTSGLKGASSRAAILDVFREKPGFNVLVLSPFVAGIGLTITEANHVVHYGRWWNPAVEAQATDRAYRIGQTKDVHVYLPILHDPSGQIPVTFDQRLDELMERRYRLAEDFLRPLDEDAMGRELYDGLAAEGG